MKKNILLSLVVSTSISLLHASDSYLLEPEAAVKMINSKSVQFISIGTEQNIITGSTRVDINKLLDIDVLGNMKCEPFLICPQKLKKYLEDKEVSSNQELILYDGEYGINAATLYFMLKAMGHKNIKILNANYESIQKLDPNQESYNKYLKEKKIILSLDNNDSNKDKSISMIEGLTNKLSVLKPLLLVQKVSTKKRKDTNTSYELDRSKFSFDSLIDKDLLKKAVNKVRKEGVESNISIVDACSMIDIVGNAYGSYASGVYSIDWKDVISSEKKTLKSKELLQEIFEKRGLKKEKDIYVYCMGESQKAFYLALALHQAEYLKVKVFSGNWSVWRRD